MKASHCRDNHNHAASHGSHKRRKPSGIPVTAAAAKENGIELHAITDHESIQHALSAVIHAVAAGTLDTARAKVLLYGLQIASANARKVQTNSESKQVVRLADPIDRNESSCPFVIDAKPACDTTGQIDDLQPKKNEEFQPMELVQKDEPARETESKGQTHEQYEVGKETSSSADDSGGPAHIPTPLRFSSMHDYSSDAKARLRALRQRME